MDDTHTQTHIHWQITSVEVGQLRLGPYDWKTVSPGWHLHCVCAPTAVIKENLLVKCLIFTYGNFSTTWLHILSTSSSAGNCKQLWLNLRLTKTSPFFFCSSQSIFMTAVWAAQAAFHHRYKSELVEYVITLLWLSYLSSLCRYSSLLILRWLSVTVTALQFNPEKTMV